MAMQSAVFSPPQGKPTILTLTAGTNSLTTKAPARLFVVTCDNDVFIEFGPSTLSGTSATMASEPIWAKSYLTFDVGRLDDQFGTVNYFNVFNNGAGTAKVYIWALGV